MKKIIVRLKNRSYPIIIGNDLISRIGRLLKPLKLGSKILIVSNPRIKRRFSHFRPLISSLKKSGFQVYEHLLSHGNEADKSALELDRLWKKMAQIPLDRSSTVLAFGGGVVGDLAGFAASTYMRGISLIQVPTTLLAQVDSAIGGKTAINLTSAKNVVGAFYQPKIVISDIDALKKLARDSFGRLEFKNSFMEVIKYGVIQDASLFELLERNVKSFFVSLRKGKIGKKEESFLETVVWRSARVKAQVVSADEREVTGKRIILNYGHTFAHALEGASRYRLPHGQAVGIGMILAGELGVKMGVFSRQAQVRQKKLIDAVGLQLRYNDPSSQLLSFMKRDKKARSGKLKFVLPLRIGRVNVFDYIPEQLIREVMNQNKGKSL